MKAALAWRPVVVDRADLLLGLRLALADHRLRPDPQRRGRRRRARSPPSRCRSRWARSPGASIERPFRSRAGRSGAAAPPSSPPGAAMAAVTRRRRGDRRSPGAASGAAAAGGGAGLRRRGRRPSAQPSLPRVKHDRRRRLPVRRARGQGRPTSCSGATRMPAPSCRRWSGRPSAPARAGSWRARPPARRSSTSTASTAGRTHRCSDFNDAVLAFLQERDDMPVVILAGRWALAVGGHPAGRARAGRAARVRPGARLPSGTVEDNFAVFEAGIARHGRGDPGDRARGW